MFGIDWIYLELSIVHFANAMALCAVAVELCAVAVEHLMNNVVIAFSWLFYAVWNIAKRVFQSQRFRKKKLLNPIEKNRLMFGWLYKIRFKTKSINKYNFAVSIKWMVTVRLFICGGSKIEID